MSYNLQVWENPPDKPLPASIDEAVHRVEELCEHELAVPSPKFMALAERLLKQYPDLSTARPAEGEDEVDYNGLAWSETIDGDGLDAVWGLGLNTGELFEKARDLVIQEVNTLGLCALDEQAGEAYLPGGKVLAMPGRVASSVVAAAPKLNVSKPPARQYTLTIGDKTHTFDLTTWIDSRTKAVDVGSPKNKEVVALAFEYLTPLMIEHGYKAYKGKRLFKSTFSQGWCEIEMFKGSDMWPMHAELEIYISLHCHPITELVSKIGYPKRPPESVAETTTLYVDPEQWMENFDNIEVNNTCTSAGAYYVQRYDQIKVVLENLSMKFQTLVLPALTDCQTVADIDRYLNQPDETAKSFFKPWGSEEHWGYTRLIAAYLVGNPMLDALCERYSKRPNGLPVQNPVVDYIRSHPL